MMNWTCGDNSPTADAPLVLGVLRNSTLHVILNRPTSKNALDRQMFTRLSLLMKQAAQEEAVGSVVISARGPCFCIGTDLTLIENEATPEATREILAQQAEWIVTLKRSRKILVVAVNGAAIGAGFSLALLGDVVFASHRAWFQSGYLALGIAPDLGLAKSLSRAIGPARAKEILLSGRRVTAQEAAQFGIVSKIVSQDQVEIRALELAAKFDSAPPMARAMTMRLIDAADHLDWTPYFELEAEAQAATVSAGDYTKIMERRRAARVGSGE